MKTIIGLIACAAVAYCLLPSTPPGNAMQSHPLTDQNVSHADNTLTLAPVMLPQAHVVEISADLLPPPNFDGLRVPAHIDAEVRASVLHTDQAIRDTARLLAAYARSFSTHGLATLAADDPDLDNPKRAVEQSIANALKAFGSALQKDMTKPTGSAG
jgi:hypothetical protein